MKKAYEVLDGHCERKAGGWPDTPMPKAVGGDSGIIEYVDGLEVHAISGDPLSSFPEGCKHPQRFIAINGVRAFYVNTEGYSYCRYVGRLPRKLEVMVLDNIKAAMPPEKSDALSIVQRQALEIIALSAKVAEVEAQNRFFKMEVARLQNNCDYLDAQLNRFLPPG